MGYPCQVVRTAESGGAGAVTEFAHEIASRKIRCVLRSRWWLPPAGSCSAMTPVTPSDGMPAAAEQCHRVEATQGIFRSGDRHPPQPGRSQERGSGTGQPSHPRAAVLAGFAGRRSRTGRGDCPPAGQGCPCNPGSDIRALPRSHHAAGAGTAMRNTAKLPVAARPTPGASRKALPIFPSEVPGFQTWRRDVHWLRAWRSSWYRQHVAVELAAVRVGHETPLESSSSRDLAGLGPRPPRVSASAVAASRSSATWPRRNRFWPDLVSGMCWNPAGEAVPGRDSTTSWPSPDVASARTSRGRTNGAGRCGLLVSLARYPRRGGHGAFIPRWSSWILG